MTPYETVRAHYDASACGGFAGMMAPIDDETEWVEQAGLPFGGTYVGRQAVIDVPFWMIPVLFDGSAFTLDELLDAGASVIAIGRYAATVRATGRRFDVPVVHVWSFRAGQLTRFRNFTDSALIAAAASAQVTCP